MGPVVLEHSLVIPEATEEQKRRAALLIANYAASPEDCRELLTQLGLIPGPPPPPRTDEFETPHYCLHGHLRTPENTRYRPKHGRQCLDCDRERKRIKRDKRKE